MYPSIDWVCCVLTLSQVSLCMQTKWKRQWIPIHAADTTERTNSWKDTKSRAATNFIIPINLLIIFMINYETSKNHENCPRRLLQMSCFVWLTVQSPKTFSFQLSPPKKSSTSSHVRSWNLIISSHLCLKNYSFSVQQLIRSCFQLAPKDSKTKARVHFMQIKNK